jgi:hypothetical protein
VRRRPEAPGVPHLGQAAAVPTYGMHQVDNKDPLFNSEFETGGGETPQTPAPSGPQTAPTATAVGVVGIPLQHNPRAVHRNTMYNIILTQFYPHIVEYD